MSASRKRFAFIATATAAVLVGSGVAVAFWTTTGTGSGTGAVGTSTAVTVTQDSTVAGLIPGGPAADLDFTVANSAAGPQTINGVAVVMAVTSSPGTCTTADFSLVQPSIGGSKVIPATDDLSFTSGASGDVANTGAEVSMVNSGSNQNGCKGATLSFTYNVS